MTNKALLILIFALISVINAKTLKKNPKIVIVGAGLSGLSAAVRLLENDYDDIIILEAENRIGGRIYSVKFSDGFIDLGGQWVHGQKNNSVYDIVAGKYDFGETGFDNYSPTFMQSDGAPLDQELCKKLGETAFKILFGSYDEMSKFEGSIEEYFKSSFRKQAREFKADYSLVNEMTDFYEKEMNIWNGSMSWNDLSAHMHCISGHNAGIQHLTWKRDGYKKFIDFLIQDNQDVLDKIMFNKEVVNIQWTKNYENKLPIITTSDGYKFSADHIIFTGSLGVLKDRHRTLFSPQLPITLRRAIEYMGYGVIGKIFLEFDQSFWGLTETNWVAYGFLWTKEDIKELTGTKREWLLDVQAFAKLDAFPNVLEALLAGRHMKEFETIPDEQIIDDCMWVLEKFLQKQLPRPKSMARTKWLTAHNFMGSYSYNSVNAFKFNVTTKDLQETLYNLKKKPEILFAGEHTDELYSSNAHGAVNSGFRVADELIKYYS
ncbi:spermine oxidase-like [Chironomus tepperi]|uniref:spermine oxidase-like n=1 Tax=Chironomus tepperi TaxID=113505 RepID=UPI00391FC001